MNTSEVNAALEKRFNPARGWALFWEMSAVWNPGRRVDLMAMCTWPSRGLDIHGVEVKTSRSDWLVELRNPAKAEQSAFRYCDYWWVAVGDATIVKDGELPSTWGLLVPRGKALVAKVKAPKLEPRPVDRLLLARVAQRYVDGPGYEETREKVNQAYRRGLDDSQRQDEATLHRAEEQAKSARKELERARQQFKAFEEAAGVRLGGWQEKRVIELARAAARILTEDQRHEGLKLDLTRVRHTLLTMANSLSRQIGELEPEKEG